MYPRIRIIIIMADSELPRTSLLSKYRDSMQELQETLIKEKKWRQDAENENRNLRKKNLEAEEQITEFRYSAVGYVANIEELAGKNTNLQGVCDEIREKLEKSEKNCDRLKGKEDALRKEMNKQEQIMNELKLELLDKQRTLEDWKTTIIGLEEQIKLYENDFFKIKEELIVYKNAYKDCEVALQNKEKECKELYENFKIINEENDKFREQEAWISENQNILESKTKQLIEDEKKLNNSYKAKLVLANENIEKLRIENERYSEIVQEIDEIYFNGSSDPSFWNSKKEITI